MRLRARAAVARYYDGALVSDDELAPGPTRDICLRSQAGLEFRVYRSSVPHPLTFIPAMQAPQSRGPLEMIAYLQTDVPVPEKGCSLWVKTCSDPKLCRACWGHAAAHIACTKPS